MESRHESNSARLESALLRSYCFVVVQDKSSNHILGFVSMRVDELSQVAYLQDIVIDRPLSPPQSGFALWRTWPGVWASEYDLRQIHLRDTDDKLPLHPSLPRRSASVSAALDDHHFANREIAVFFSLSI